LATKDNLPALSNRSKRLAIHTMRLFLNVVLVPFFLLKFFASAVQTEYTFSITWKTQDAVGTCTDLMADVVSTTVMVKANIYLSGGPGLPEVANWHSGKRNGGNRQLRGRDLCGGACTYEACAGGSNCYDCNNCEVCGRREERQLYQVERALTQYDITELENGLMLACQDALDEEVVLGYASYSTSCIAALTEQLCDAVVTEVV
jgi:hypothetical protein